MIKGLKYFGIDILYSVWNSFFPALIVSFVLGGKDLIVACIIILYFNWRLAYIENKRDESFRKS